MAQIQTEDLPFLKDLLDEELEQIFGGSPLAPLNGLHQITIQTDEGDIL